MFVRSSKLLQVSVTSGGSHVYPSFEFHKPNQVPYFHFDDSMAPEGFFSPPDCLLMQLEYPPDGFHHGRAVRLLGLLS